jgi:lipoate-protein ligase A
MAGIETELSGRNDILANGRKFSGNAFYNSKGNSYHHGTLLISADMNKMGKYLTPSKSKLQAKGVKSVESRVVNLSELCPDLTVDKMRENMILAAEEVYGLKAQQMSQIEFDKKQELTELYGSWDYIYGTSIPADFACDGRFSWGGIQLKFIVKNGTIEQVQVFSDSMDFEISEKLQNALNDQKFEKQIIAEILFEKLEKEVAEDILSIIENAIF